MTGADSVGSRRSAISPRAAALALGLILLLVGVGPAAGQASRTVAPDDVVRVRVDAPPRPGAAPGWTRGRVAAVAPDSLWMGTEPSGETVAIPASELLELQVAVPRGFGAGMLRGALFGALAGAGAGLLAGAATGGGDEGFGSSASVAYWAGGGAMVGVPVGALVGAAFRGSRWVAARLPDP